MNELMKSKLGSDGGCEGCKVVVTMMTDITKEWGSLAFYEDPNVEGSNLPPGIHLAPSNHSTCVVGSISQSELPVAVRSFRIDRSSCKCDDFTIHRLK